MENLNPEPTNAGEEKILPKPKRIKPDIEGITVPAAGKTKKPGPKLTSAEQQLIEETGPSQVAKPASSKITLPKRKPHYFTKTVLYLLLLAALGFGGYKGYLWYSENADLIVIDQFNDNTDQTAPDGSTDNPALTDMPAAGTTSTSSVLSTTDTGTQPTSSTPSLAEDLIEAQRVKIASTETGWLNVRKEPSTASAVITKVYPQDMFIYTDYKNGWYKITLPNKGAGWVNGQYVTKM